MNKFAAYKFMSLVILLLIAAKCWVDIDSYWDTWAYHLPFAGRLWNIIPADQYVFDPLIQRRFEGMPMLGEFFQGLFWWLTHHIEATNYFAFCSFLILLAALWHFFRLPFYVTTIALLAVPLIQIHASMSYIDLPGNVFIAICLLITYKVWLNPENANSKTLGVAAIASVLAANIKMLFIPLVCVCWAIMGASCLPSYLKHFNVQPKSNHTQKLFCYTLVGFITVGLVFATPIKNTFYHANPFHGIKVAFNKQVVSQGEDFTYDVPHYLVNASGPQRWVYSLMEVYRPPFLWSHDQRYATSIKEQGHPADRMGGYFREYLIFHLILFGILCWKVDGKVARRTLAFFGLMSLLTSFTPMSFHLRYCMYWMILLLSLNLYLIKEYGPFKLGKVTIGIGTICLINLLSFIIVVTATRFQYIAPQKHTLAYLHQYMVQNRLNNIPRSQTYCVSGVFPYTMLYTSYFNSKKGYSVEDAGQNLDLNVQVLQGSCATKQDPEQARKEFMGE